MHVDAWLRDAEAFEAGFAVLSKINQVFRIRTGSDKVTIYLGDLFEGEGKADPVAFLEQIVDAARKGIKYYEGVS